MTSLKELNKKVEDARLAFIQTKDKTLKEKLLNQILDIKKEFELDNLEDIQEDLKLHKYIKTVCNKALTELMDKNADAFQIKEIYGNLMSAKAMISNYENMIEQNKRTLDQLHGALKGSMSEKKKEEKA